MRAVAIILLLVASACAFESFDEKRDIADFILNTFGLREIWVNLQQAGTGVFNNLLSDLFAALARGREVLDQALVIVKQLIQDVKDHLGNAAPFVQNAVGQLNQLLRPQGKRDLSDFIFGALGLGAIKESFQGISANLVQSFQAALTQLLLQGTQALNNARPIIQQLVSDLTSHVGNSGTIVQGALQQLNGVLAQHIGKRDIWDFVVNAFGLGSIWSTLQEAGSTLVGKFTEILSQLLFAGQQAWANARPILSQLTSDLTNHVGSTSTILSNAVSQLSAVLAGSGKRDVLSFMVNSFGLSDVWTTIQSLAGSLTGQFQAALTQLLFSGQQAWSSALQVFNQLRQDLTNHVGDASLIVASAVSQLNNIMAQQGRY